MPISILLLHDFMALFSGNDTARGVFIPSGKLDEKGKVLGQVFTERSMPTDEHYMAHLEGKKGLGIVPIRTDSKCTFGVIDVDDTKQFSILPKIITKHSFPLIPFRSKSGGLHLYVFFTEPVPAKKVISLLQEMRRMLGLPKNTEIFPKQSKLDENSSGSWINLPYFDAEKTDRFLSLNDKRLSLSEALVYCSNNRKSVDDLKTLINSIPMNDGPPCLQTIFIRGYTSMRNNYLFSAGVYCKSKYGDDFEHKLVEINSSLEAPLSIKELQTTIINSLQRKDYAYKCSEEPLCSLCDKSVCRQKEYGIGSSSVPELTFEQLKQFEADPPYYEWIINSKPLRFYSETEIINQTAFRTLCFRCLHVLPNRLKDETWTRVVNTALSNIQVIPIEAGDDISVGATFREYLVEFLTKRAPAANKEQILMDRVYRDEDKKVYIFRAKNLINFLIVQKSFRAFGQTEIQARLKDMRGKAIRYYINTKNSAARVWELPFEAIEKYSEPDIDSIDISFQEEFLSEEY